MRLAIVTGGGSGLGRHLSLGLAAAGTGVMVADISAEAAETTAAQVRDRGVTGLAVPADIRDPVQCRRLVRLAAEHGGPHVLINNAGGWTPGEQWPAAPDTEWTATMTLNLTAPMLLSQLVLAPMRDLGGGVIVNISSSAGAETAGYGSPEYGAAKAGLIRFTTALADLDETHGVRVTCIVPNWIGLDRAYAELDALTPEERAGKPPLIPPADIVATALRLIEQGKSGTVVEMLR